MVTADIADITGDGGVNTILVKQKIAFKNFKFANYQFDNAAALRRDLLQVWEAQLLLVQPNMLLSSMGPQHRHE